MPENENELKDSAAKHDEASAAKHDEVEQLQAEEFAEEMHAEPKNIDGEPGVASVEEETAVEAVESMPAEENLAPNTGEPGVASVEEETAAEAVEPMPAEENLAPNTGEPGVPSVEEQTAAAAVEPMPAEENLAPNTGEPGVPSVEEQTAAAAVEPMPAEENLAPNIGEPRAASLEEETAAAAVESMPAGENLAPNTGEPGVDSVEEETAAAAVEPMPAGENLAPNTGEPGVDSVEEETAAAAVESMSAEEILAPDAGKEQPKWPAEDAELTAMLEAVIYITDEPLTLEQISTALEQPRERMKRLLDDLVAEWQKPQHGLSIREVAGGYKMATKPEHHDAVRQFVKSLKPPMKLSLPALETLAVIAYKQPVTAPEIMDIRGVQGAGVLKTLLDRKLIAAAGRKNVIGKPILYKTTREFLVQFGLKDLSELPSVKEFEELARFATAEPEAAAPAAATPASQAPAPEAPAPEALPAAAPEPAPAAAEETQPEPIPEPVAE